MNPGDIYARGDKPGAYVAVLSSTAHINLGEHVTTMAFAPGDTPLRGELGFLDTIEPEGVLVLYLYESIPVSALNQLIGHLPHEVLAQARAYIRVTMQE